MKQYPTIITSQFCERKHIMKSARLLLVAFSVLTILICIGCEEQPQPTTEEPQAVETTAQPDQEIVNVEQMVQYDADA